MADVISQSYVSIAGSQRTMAEGWTWNAGGDIHESRPSSATIVEKDGGLPNHSFTVDWTDASFAFFQVLYPLQLTTTAYILRPDDAAKGGSNPQLAGNAVVNIGSVPFVNGGIVRGSSTFEVDSVALTT